MREGGTGPGQARHRPTLRQVLRRHGESQVQSFLLLREAILALGEISERVVLDKTRWVPTFLCRDQEFLRVVLSDPGSKNLPTLIIHASREILLGLGREVELSLATRRRLRRAARQPGRPEVVLTLRGEAQMAEALAVAMLLKSRLSADF